MFIQAVQYSGTVAGLNLDFFILLSAIHCSTTVYYVLYEILVVMFGVCGFPELPVDKTFIFGDLPGFLLIPVKLVLVAGSVLILFGSTNLKLRYIGIGLLILAPYVVNDVFVIACGRSSSRDKFLLFQRTIKDIIVPLRIAVLLLGCLAMMGSSGF